VTLLCNIYRQPARAPARSIYECRSFCYFVV